MEIIHFSFPVPEFVSAKKDFIEFKENVEFVELDKFMTQSFSVARENKLFAIQIKFIALQPKHVFALLDTIE